MLHLRERYDRDYSFLNSLAVSLLIKADEASQMAKACERRIASSHIASDFYMLLDEIKFYANSPRCWF